MPYQIQPTITEVRDAALARLGIPLDGGNSAAILQVVEEAVRSAQRQLQVNSPWLCNRAIVTRALTIGQQFVDLPAGCEPGRITRMKWSNGTKVYNLDAGVTFNMDQLMTGLPQGWDVRGTYGVQRIDVGGGGTGFTTGSTLTIAAPDGTNGTNGEAATAVINTLSGGSIVDVTVTNSGSTYAMGATPAVTPTIGSGATLTAIVDAIPAIYLAPQPTSAGTLIIEFWQQVPKLTSDTSRVGIDGEAVTQLAAILAGPSIPQVSPDVVAMLAKSHDGYLSNLRRMKAEDRTTNLGPAGRWA